MKDESGELSLFDLQLTEADQIHLLGGVDEYAKKLEEEIRTNVVDPSTAEQAWTCEPSMHDLVEQQRALMLSKLEEAESKRRADYVNYST